MTTATSPRFAVTPSYDVFISHNQQQKPWVRELAGSLQQAGLTVFFDEESVAPGANFVRVIGDAVEASRHVLLVISPSALESQWVGLEMAIAVGGDPTGSKGQVIPVLLERVEARKIPPELRIRSMVDLTEPVSREANLRRLLAFLIGPAATSLPLPPWPTSTRRVADMEEVSRWGWSGEQLLSALVRLDDGLYGASTEAHDDLVSRWTPMFTSHPETWRLLVDAPRSVVGYWHFVSLFEDDLSAASRGELLYREITADRIRVLELPGRYDLYFSGIGIQDRCRTPMAFRLLFGSLLEVATALAKHGTFFESIWANGYTPQGVSLCRSLGLGYVIRHRHRGDIFSARFSDILDRPIFRLQAELIPLYEEEELRSNGGTAGQQGRMTTSITADVDPAASPPGIS